MALSPFPVTHQACVLSSSHSLYYLILQTKTQNNSFRALKFKSYCVSHQTIKVGIDISKKKRKPKPSFLYQIKDKWSQKPIISTREKLPWQEKEELEEQEEVQKEQTFEATASETESDEDPRVEASDQVSFPLPSRVIAAPWSHGRKFNELHFDFVPESPEFESQIEVSFANEKPIDFVGDRIEKPELLDEEISFNKQKPTLSAHRKIAAVEGINEVVSSRQNLEVSTNGSNEGGSIEGDGKSGKKKSNTEMAERMIPEHELRRLRNFALRMVERTKVGAAGITQALVEHIHERWKLDEVIKLKFEEPLSLNMKRTHEVLEKRTGGLVIWRAGGSVVLYRGMAYKLHCVQSYSGQDQADTSALDVITTNTENMVVKDCVRTEESFMPSSSEYLKDLSKEELMDLCELNHLLDELGPRYKDWSGREPLPVDADLLPPVVPGYQPPFRRLPYGVRHCLKDCEMTTFRRLARSMPPHFALGRNRELQGLAQAIVKLWERTAIAKIAVKRGVENTRNERMAEELKRFTGGTLLSRNKEFIVFYRGNDFLPPVVTNTLKEMQKSRNLLQEEEEEARGRALALVGSNVKASTLPLVAGTLAIQCTAEKAWGLTLLIKAKMVKFLLKIAADLQNLTNLQPQGGCDDPSFSYLFKLKCENCGEVSPRETCVSLGDTVPLPRGKGTTNLIQKCKLCLRDGTVTVIPGRGKPLTQEESEAENYAPLMLFECRGYEPIDYVFGGGWKVESLEGTKFEGVDLSGGDFAEYDEEGEYDVKISNLRSTFDVVK